MKIIKTLLLAGIMIVVCGAIGNAQVIIYSDNFAIGGSGNISNTPPTLATNYAGGVSNARWDDVLGTNATGALLANGTYTPTATLGDSFVLPFTPQAGFIYLLTATVTFTNNPGNWVGLGFAQNYVSNTANGFARFSDNQAGGLTSPRGDDWMIITEGSGNLQYFAGPGGAPTIYNANGTFTPGPGTNTMLVVLNTKASPWSIAGFDNGAQMGTNFTYASNPTIRAVGITQNTLTAPSAVQWNNLLFFTPTLPVIARQPVSAISFIGSTFSNTVTVVADTNGGTLFYQWYTNGVALANGGAISGAKTNVLLINPVSAANASASYYVVVTNTFGAVTSAVVSFSAPLASITQQPVSATKFVGVAFTNTVLAADDPSGGPLFYQWYTNNVPLANGGAISGANTNVLIINPVSFTSASANYYVIVTNTYGAITSAVVSLTVPNRPPTVAHIVTNNVTSGSTWKIALSDLATAAAWSDPDGDTVTFGSVNSTSANGTNLTHDANYIYYNGVVTVEDHLAYTITDGTLTTNGTVYVEPVSKPAAFTTGNPGVDSSGHPTFGGQGIPNYTYGVESTTSLLGPWSEAGNVTADVHGTWNFTDASQVNPVTIFYRLYYPDNPGSPPQ